MSKRDIYLYVDDIFDSINAIFDYVKEYSFENFCNDRKTYSAVIRELEIIGEAVNKLPNDLKDKYQNIVWRDIKDFRNLLIHEYFGVDLEIVWNTVKEDLPDLLNVIEEIRSQSHDQSQEYGPCP